MPSQYVVSRDKDNKGNITYGVYRYPPPLVQDINSLKQMTLAELLAQVERARKGNREPFHTGTFSWDAQGKAHFEPEDAVVRAVPAKAPSYLTTEPNDNATDNLESLPPFKGVEAIWAMIM